MSQISYPCLFFSYMMLVPFLIPRCSSSDCLVDGSKISDDSSQITLVSPGKVFELGFFTPDGSFSNNRYLGIWYYRTNPRIIVWVANREKPLPETNGYVAVRDGKVEILDKNNFTFWKTNYVPSVSSAKLCLDDHGNLVLSSSEGNPILWQSFDHPTDTILPGMRLNGSLNLTSWKNGSNPAPGESLLLLQPGKDPTMIIKETGYSQYWDSGADPIARIPSLLIDVHGEISLRNNTRLVMNSTGQIQWWKWGSESGWSLFWWEPKDRCSFDTVCGNFGSCNGNSGLPCKCLPGFKPSLLQEWNEGCFSGGCVPESGFPCQRPNSFNDTFLRLPMMKVEAECRASTEDNCEDHCLWDCTCVAYSYDLTNCSGAGTPTGKRCSIWYNQLPRLQEEYSQGITLYVRTPSSGIGSTSRDCNPCGAYAIPYPLSTDETKCGDSSYSNFNCNSETGQVNFSTTTGTFRVTLINPDTKSFTIQVMDVNSCDNIHSSVLSSNKSLPFFVRECTVYKDKPLIQLRQPFIEVDIGWQPPPEPSCSVSSDCVAWPHTSCKAAKMATRRCICGPKFRWDGSKLKCTRVHFPFEAVVPCIAVVLVISILCGVFFAYRKRERKIAEKQGSIKFEGDDTEGLDVPLFGWGSILSATNNFADANKLGTGGFGSVYRGKLPDGQEIAVKRLSSVSMQGVTEFRTEVVLIARLQHRNLVRLLGYCVKADEKILVYEYMRNGSLDSCLFDRTFSAYLDWEKRFDIIFGIARGLVYLHQDSRLRIIHRDLKPSNILLDEELNPKISDFGVARIVEGKETEANTNKVVGTYGYMSPEYALEGFFSFKSDVFSFGVVVLETVSGRRNARTSAFEPGLSRLSLLGHAWKLWTEDRGLEFVDPALKESCNPDEVLRCIYVGLLCVQSDPADRPTMPTIVLMLSNGESTMSHSLPKKPAYFTRTSTSETASSSSLGCTSSFSNMITMSTEGR